MTEQLESVLFSAWKTRYVQGSGLKPKWAFRMLFEMDSFPMWVKFLLYGCWHLANELWLNWHFLLPQDWVEEDKIMDSKPIESFCYRPILIFFLKKLTIIDMSCLFLKRTTLSSYMLTLINLPMFLRCYTWHWKSATTSVSMISMLLQMVIHIFVVIWGMTAVSMLLCGCLVPLVIGYNLIL